LRGREEKIGGMGRFRKTKRKGREQLQEQRREGRLKNRDELF
jgi:hypothetical protein